MDDERSSGATDSAGTDRRRLILGGAAVAAGAWIAPTIISTSAASAATCLPVPPPLVLGGAASFLADPSGPSELIRNDTDAFVWPEAGPVTITSPLTVDATTIGAHTIASTTTSATIPAATTVFSYFVHFRPTAAGGSRYNTGSITIPAGYSFGGLAFNATGAAPVSPATCVDGTGALRTTAAFADPAVDYAACRLIGHGYEDALYAGNPLAPPPAWELPPISVVRDTVVVSGGPGPGTPTIVTWYCFTGVTNSDDFRLFVVPEAC